MLALFILGLIHTSTSLKVTVYYETLCPHSVDFITNQLYPNYNIFSNVIELELIPYGKATQEFVDNVWKFVCQHGPDECYGNTYHACVLHQNVNEDVMVDFIYCSMSAASPASEDTLYECALQQGLSWPTLKSCYENEGGQLLADYGDITHAFNLSVVPTITYNNKYDQQLHTESRTNFTNVVCGLLEQDQRPSICNSSAVLKTSLSLLIGIVVVSFLGAFRL